MENYNNELDELAELYLKVGTETQKLAAPLFNEAYFQSTQLERLRDEIKTTGWTSEYWNGSKQRGTIESAAGKAYHKLIKDFNGTIKTLHTVLENKIPEPEDEFVAFTKKETR